MLDDLGSFGGSQTNVLLLIELGDDMLNSHKVFTLPIPETNQIWERQVIQLWPPNENRYL